VQQDGRLADPAREITGGVRRRRAIAVLRDRVVLGVVADDPGAPERLDVDRRCRHRHRGYRRGDGAFKDVLNVATNAPAR
jgi:hypothetical protein